MSEDTNASRVSVSLQTLRQELNAWGAQLELRLVDRFTTALIGKADQDVVKQLFDRVTNLELHSIRQEGPLADAVKAHGTRLDRIEDAQQTQGGAYALAKWAVGIAAIVGSGALGHFL